MTQIDDQAAAEQAEGLEARIARQLLDQAKAEGVSLVGPGGLLAGRPGRCCRPRWMRR